MELNATKKNLPLGLQFHRVVARRDDEIDHWKMRMKKGTNSKSDSIIKTLHKTLSFPQLIIGLPLFSVVIKLLETRGLATTVSMLGN